MKQFIAILLIIATIITLNHVCFTKGTVISVHDDVVVVESRGEVWAFYGDNFAVGQKVKLVFNTNNTNITVDDEIIFAK